jgi:hypothetical protein
MRIGIAADQGPWMSRKKPGDLRPTSAERTPVSL